MSNLPKQFEETIGAEIQAPSTGKIGFMILSVADVLTCSPVGAQNGEKLRHFQ
jgi:hypothetical protein